jgi:hypothetical protein
MKKIFLGLILLLVPVSLAQAGPLPVTDSGVSVGSADNTIGALKSSWDAAQANDWIVFWLKIPPSSDMANGLVRYQYKITYTSPDRTGVASEGPFNFDSIGYAKVSKQVSFFDNIKTSFSPKPNEGKWLIEFTLIDTQNGNKEDLGARLPFYLTGNDKAQKPAAASTPPAFAATTTASTSTTTTSLSNLVMMTVPMAVTTTSTTTTSLSNMAMADPTKSIGTSEAKKAKKKSAKAKKKHHIISANPTPEATTH